MAISVFDLFSIGIGPSSSHTVGPMRAAHHFAHSLPSEGITHVEVRLYGSLALTGKGHGTDTAILLGLSGWLPEAVGEEDKVNTLSRMEATHQLRLRGETPVPFDAGDIQFLTDQALPEHANGMMFRAFQGNDLRHEAIYYSTGGGFVCLPGGRPLESAPPVPVPFPLTTAESLIRQCREHELTISQLMWQNETAMREASEVKARLLSIWATMDQCIERGLAREGILPGGLRVRRRAPGLYQRLVQQPPPAETAILDWLSVYAMAVNEENAAGARVVTAPTNGAAGILPAVLKYHLSHRSGNDEDQVIMDYLLTAGAIGILYKECASLSAAEVGCQGEVGVACSMAAGALAAIQGGTVEQVENAAEIGMEHNLGLTCDPVGGLVQIPCIERNTMGAVKAVNAAHLALNADGRHLVSLDKVIRTMLRTGKDMQTRYKETSLGGLAIQVGMPEC